MDSNGFAEYGNLIVRELMDLRRMVTDQHVTALREVESFMADIEVQLSEVRRELMEMKDAFEENGRTH